MRLCIVLGSLCCLTYLVSGAQEKEAPREINGKTLEQWIKEISSKDRSHGESAIRNVAMFGPDQAYEAVPVLIAELKRHSSFVQVDVSIRVNTTIALGVILGGNKKAEPDTVKDAVVVLNRMLGDTQEMVRAHAAEALGKIGPPARAAIPLLFNALHDVQSWKTRKEAAGALGPVAYDGAEPPATVIDNLLRALGDPASPVRISALQSLSGLGTASKRKAQLTTSIASRTRNDPEPAVRIWSTMALINLSGNVSEGSVRNISTMLADPDSSTRLNAMQALAMLGPKARAAIPKLISALDDKDEAVVMSAITALMSMGKDASSAVAKLRSIADAAQRHPAIRQAAERGVAFITATPEKKRR